jgi:hypothetical protein
LEEGNADWTGKGRRGRRERGCGTEGRADRAVEVEMEVEGDRLPWKGRFLRRTISDIKGLWESRMDMEKKKDKHRK